MNSATEISTDSEFEQDPIIRETPQIFIDDTHLKRPTKVQVFVTYIYFQQKLFNLLFKIPLFLSNR